MPSCGTPVRCEARAGAASGSGGPWSRLRWVSCYFAMLTAQVGPHQLAASEGERCPGLARPRRCWPAPPFAARGCRCPQGSRAQCAEARLPSAFQGPVRALRKDGDLGGLGGLLGAHSRGPVGGRSPRALAAPAGCREEGPGGAGRARRGGPGFRPGGRCFRPVAVRKTHSASRARKCFLVYFVASCLFLLSSKNQSSENKISAVAPLGF